MSKTKPEDTECDNSHPIPGVLDKEFIETPDHLTWDELKELV